MIGSMFDGPEGSLPAHEALVPGQRVIYNSAGRAQLASATQQAIGITCSAAAAQGDIVRVRWLTAPGTLRILADGNIARGDGVKAAAAGRIVTNGSLVSGNCVEGVAFSDAAQGTYCEVLPVNRRIIA